MDSALPRIIAFSVYHVRVQKSTSKSQRSRVLKRVNYKCAILWDFTKSGFIVNTYSVRLIGHAQNIVFLRKLLARLIYQKDSEKPCPTSRAGMNRAELAYNILMTRFLPVASGR